MSSQNPEQEAPAAAGGENVGAPADAASGANGSVSLPIRNRSKSEIPPPGHSLTGKQEHCAFL